MTTDQPNTAPAPAPVDPALQQRIAAAVRAAVTRTIDLRHFDTQIATAVLAELAPELDALTAARAGDGPWLRAYREDMLTAQQQAKQAESAITRVRAQCAEWARPIRSGTWDARIRDDIAAACADMILRALTPPTPAEGSQA